jgi:hypothetical protein
MTQGKIERYHRSLKNVICLDPYTFPWQLEEAVAAFVQLYNFQRYHEALDNLTPADVLLGRKAQVLSTGGDQAQNARPAPCRLSSTFFVCLGVYRYTGTGYLFTTHLPCPIFSDEIQRSLLQRFGKKGCSCLA